MTRPRLIWARLLALAALAWCLVAVQLGDIESEDERRERLRRERR